MDIIKWANGEGQKLILSKEEAADLVAALEMALRLGSFDDGKFFEVEIKD